MDEILAKFAAAHRRDVEFFKMVPGEFNGERFVEILTLTETGAPLVLRVTNPEWLTADMRDAADGWAARQED